ncbi:peroxisome assembly protein 12 [Coccinella septempunctata]|uniref:peroxisome assembly protein 12 n=1 Tax=Coccinella septempunctata TaxID=41139 RepID=UPI001D06A16E|nr:peroxisome assembly protein 12 [Coccinella septempunctata]
MAYYAANFTTTSQSKPSFLEVLAQDSLSDVLYPAFRTLISNSSSGTNNWLLHHEYFLLAANGLLQYYYFKNFDASFSENFYGLKRVHKDGTPLRESYKIFCATYVAILPYLKKRIEERYNYYMTQDVEGVLGNGFSDLVKKKFVALYPAFQSAWNLWLIVNYLKYMGNVTDSQLPFLHLLNLKLVYSTENQNSQFWTLLFKGNLSGAEFCRGFLKNVVMGCLEGLAIYTQFTQSISNIIPNFSMEALPKIGPPAADNKSEPFKEKCPLCKQFWKLPTVLPVSGYVFCFTCIMKHLREYQCCPVTRIPARPLDVVRIFEGE